MSLDELDGRTWDEYPACRPTRWIGDGLWSTSDPDLTCRTVHTVRPMFELLRVDTANGCYRFEAADLDDPEVTVR